MSALHEADCKLVFTSHNLLATEIRILRPPLLKRERKDSPAGDLLFTVDSVMGTSVALARGTTELKDPKGLVVCSVDWFKREVHSLDMIAGVGGTLRKVVVDWKPSLKTESRVVEWNKRQCRLTPMKNGFEITPIISGCPHTRPALTYHPSRPHIFTEDENPFIVVHKQRYEDLDETGELRMMVLLLIVAESMRGCKMNIGGERREDDGSAPYEPTDLPEEGGIQDDAPIDVAQSNDDGPKGSDCGVPEPGTDVGKHDPPPHHHQPHVQPLPPQHHQHQPLIHGVHQGVGPLTSPPAHHHNQYQYQHEHHHNQYNPYSAASYGSSPVNESPHQHHMASTYIDTSTNGWNSGGGGYSGGGTDYSSGGGGGYTGGGGSGF